MWLLPAFVAMLALGSPYNITVHPRQTDALLMNPDMGWFMGSDTNHPERFADVLPYITTVYLRLPWSAVEPQEGKFAWNNPKFGGNIKFWTSHGKKIAFRLVSYSPINWAKVHFDEIRYDTPKYVFDAGAEGFPDASNIMVPVFWDPAYLQKLHKFVMALGRRFNGDPDIAFVEIGSMGAWGEGHLMVVGDEKLDSHGYTPEKYAAAYRRMVDMFLEAFPDTLVTKTVDGPGQVNDYAAARGIGMRFDSLGMNWSGPPDSPAGWSPRDYSAFDKYWLQAPCIFETATAGKYTDVWRADGNARRFYSYALTKHPTYMALPMWNEFSVEMVQRYPELFREIGRRIGYRFVLTEATYPRILTPGQRFEVRTEWENQAVAKRYKPAFFELTLCDKSGIPYWRALYAPRTPVTDWLPDKTIEETRRFRFPPSNSTNAVPPGRYYLRIALLDATRNNFPLYLGLAGRDENGRYLIGRVWVRSRR